MINKTISTYGYNKDENTNFYFMSIGEDESYATFIPEKGENPKSLVECAICGGIKRRVLNNLKCSFKGKKKADIYHHVRYIITSKKVIKILKENNVVGYKTYDVEIINSSQFSLGYLSSLRCLEITGRCYGVFNIYGEKIDHCSNCTKVSIEEKQKSEDGLQVNTDFWDGSDIFLFDYGLLHIIVTEKLKKIFEEHKVKNVQFYPISELTMLSKFYTS